MIHSRCWCCCCRCCCCGGLFDQRNAGAPRGDRLVRQLDRPPCGVCYNPTNRWIVIVFVSWYFYIYFQSFFFTRTCRMTSFVSTDNRFRDCFFFVCLLFFFSNMRRSEKREEFSDKVRLTFRWINRMNDKAMHSFRYTYSLWTRFFTVVLQRTTWNKSPLNTCFKSLMEFHFWQALVFLIFNDENRHFILYFCIKQSPFQ